MLVWLQREDGGAAPCVCLLMGCGQLEALCGAPEKRTSGARILFIGDQVLSSLNTCVTANILF